MAIEISGVTDAELDKALANIAVLPKAEQIQLLAALDELEKTQTVEKRQGTFLEFIDHVYPGYKVGNHHRRLAKILKTLPTAKRKELLLILRHDMGSLSLSHILHLLGSWESILTRKLLWRLIPLILLLTLVGEFVTWLVVTLIKTYFLR